MRGFGLSEYAARAYLALLDLGTTEARDVSGLSKVPASKIYHILDQLHEKGLVVVLPEFPRKYAPVAFSDFLGRIHDEHVAVARQIESEQDALAETFAVVGETSNGDRGSVTLLRSRRNVRERAAEVLAAAKTDVVLLLTQHQSTDPHAWEEPVRAARERGVQVQVIGEGGTRPAGLPEATFAIVADGARAFLGHCTPDDGHPTEGNDSGLDIDQQGIVGLLGSLLVARWPYAGAEKTRQLDVSAGPPTPSP